MSDWVQRLQDAKKMLELELMTQKEFENLRQQIMIERGLSTNTEKLSTPPITEKSQNTPLEDTNEIGPYHIFNRLGEGGMGTVYRARHKIEEMAKRQGGDVAIKVMHPQYAQRPDLRERFEREASVCLKLEHSAIVRVFDLIEEQSRLGLVMELIEGKPLSDLIGTVVGPIPWPKAKEFFYQMLNAIGYAHSMGVVHRDLKPENIMVLSDGQIKILDFGIAKESGSGKTKTNTGMGTVYYMAPEQYQDAKNVDHRADIYALGMTLYEMLAGRLPWDDATSEFDILTIKAQQSLPSPTTYYPYIPDYVVKALNRSILVSPSERISTTEEFRRYLSKDTSEPETQTTKTEIISDSEETKQSENPILQEIEIASGTFNMGSSQEGNAHPKHSVNILRSFWMSVFPCTQSLYKKVMGVNPSFHRGEQNPVDSVSWIDAVIFCNRLSEMNGLNLVYRCPADVVQSEAWAKQVQCDFDANGFRLPTEAEWEFAAKTGIRSSEQSKEASSKNLDEQAWYKGECTQPVGQKKANEHGAYDMRGNVWEWVWDGPFRNYTTASCTDPQFRDPLIAANVIRGGCYASTAEECMTFHREWFFAHKKLDQIGFRFVRNKE